VAKGLFHLLVTGVMVLTAVFVFLSLRLGRLQGACPGDAAIPGKAPLVRPRARRSGGPEKARVMVQECSASSATRRTPR
jgi:hypothetical protein